MATSGLAITADTGTQFNEVGSALDALEKGTTTRRRSRRRAAVVYLASLLVFGLLLWDGLSYYTTPFSERPRHEDYREFRPAGARGITYGVIGTSMMLLMMGYSLRKRLKIMRHWWLLPRWLDAHIYFGIMGPLFILLHTSFKVQGLVAIAFWSMVGVALSGFVGRYLYRFIPRGIHGNELTLAELTQMYEAIEEQLRHDVGLPDEGIAQMRRVVAVPQGPSEEGMMKTLSMLVRSRVGRQRLVRRMTNQMCAGFDIAPDQVRPLAILAREQLWLQSRMRALEHARRLFHYWHVMHKPFALLMYLIMLVHIGVAIWTGYATF